MLAGTPFVVFLATRDSAKARAFYGGTLGLRLVADEPFALVFDLQGTPLRIQKVESFTAQPFTAFGWTVKDIRATVAALAGAGVVMQRFPGMEQDAAGVWTSPGGARVAWFHDPDGNTLSLTEH